jgi:hypothetical protein
MPSKALQSLIDTFENLDSPNSQSFKPPVAPVQTSQNYVTQIRQDNSLLDSSTSPTASSLVSIPPIQPKAPSSRSESPSVVSTPSLIDAQDLDFLDVIPDNKPNTNILGPVRSIALVGSKNQPPLLPPRRSDSNVLTNNPSLGESVTVKHSYPPVHSGGGVSSHVPSSSVSSFHSVSLSSDGGNRESVDMDESGEFLSIPAAVPIGLEPWSKTNGSPPKLPPRPSSTPVTPISQLAKRRPPPPPPPTFPKHNTTLPAANRNVGLDAKDSTVAIDAKARSRYGLLFDRNLELQNQRRSSVTQQKGWRGTSTGFLKGPSPPSPLTRLDGYIVKVIWECSQLNKYQLRRIW